MLILPNDGKKRRKQVRSLKPTRATRGARASYQRSLLDQVRYLKAQTANLSDLLTSGAERSRVAQALAQLTQQAQVQARAAAPNMARGMVEQVDRINKQQLQSAIAEGLGVEFARIVDGPEVLANLELALTRNTALIESITSQHLAQVGQAVLDNYRGVPLPEGVSLTQRLQQIGGISENRARLIARDQTSKLAGALNSTRQQEAGIEEYTWHTSLDNRVVGTPGGLYPKGSERHEDHYEREGKTFRWDSPPSDGHPGEPIQCRCYPRPVLDLEKLKAQYV